MAIDVDCECGETFRAADALAGRTVACPACGVVVPVEPSTFRPARRDRAEFRAVSGLGVSGVSLALFGLLICWVPAAAGLVALATILGAVLSLTGLLVSAIGRQSGASLPVIGIGLNVIVFFLWGLVLASARPDEPGRLGVMDAGPGFVLPAEPPAPVPGLDAATFRPIEPEPEDQGEPPAPAPDVVPPAPAPAIPFPGVSLADSIAEEKVARDKAEAIARASRAATLLKMGRNLERAGKRPAALENYRRVASEFKDTPSAKEAQQAIKGMGK